MLLQIFSRRTLWLCAALLVALIFVNTPTPILAASMRFIAPTGTDAGTCLNAAQSLQDLYLRHHPICSRRYDPRRGGHLYRKPHPR